MKNIPVFIKVIVFILATVMLSAAIIWPLWKFATEASVIYTAVVLISLLVYIIFRIVKKAINNAKKSKM